MKKSKTQKPPYKVSLAVPVAGSTVKVKLPPASEYEIGARVEVPASYKGLTMRVKLVRVEGGWDVVD